MSTKPRQNRNQARDPSVPAVRRRPEVGLTPAESAAINDKLCEIEAMDTAGKLASRRLVLRRSLGEAREADHSAASRRALAAKHTQKAKELRAVIERIERAHAALVAARRDAAAVLNRDTNGLGNHFPPDRRQSRRPRGMPDVAYLRWEAYLSERLAKWYRSGTTEKPTQWGPATLQAVEAIANEAADGISNDNIRKDAKPKQQGDYYAALMCMQVGLLAPAVSVEPSIVADRVRKRLDRGMSIRTPRPDISTLYRNAVFLVPAFAGRYRPPHN